MLKLSHLRKNMHACIGRKKILTSFLYNDNYLKIGHVYLLGTVKLLSLGIKLNMSPFFGVTHFCAGA